MNNKICIVYICTGLYKMFFNEFYKSVNNFLPSVKKKIIVLSEEMPEYDEVNDDVELEWHYLKHYIWPIMTVFKLQHIIEFADRSCSHVFYFNANTILKPFNNISILNHDIVAGLPWEENWEQQNEFNESLVRIQGTFIGGKINELFKAFKVANDLMFRELSCNSSFLKSFDETALNYYAATVNDEGIYHQDMHEIFDLIQKEDIFNKNTEYENL